MKYQDIHISDVPNWDNVRKYWANGQYQQAINELNTTTHTNLKTKEINAELFNYFATYLTDLQNPEQYNPTFVKDTIKVTATPPTLDVGKVYFEIN